jgi:hypothetical protein
MLKYTKTLYMYCDYNRSEAIVIVKVTRSEYILRELDQNTEGSIKIASQKNEGKLMDAYTQKRLAQLKRIIAKCAEAENTTFIPHFKIESKLHFVVDSCRQNGLASEVYNYYITEFGCEKLIEPAFIATYQDDEQIVDFDEMVEKIAHLIEGIEEDDEFERYADEALHA